MFFDDFETSLGWTRNSNGTDTATTGLWERGDPEQTTEHRRAMQLGTTVSGVNDLVTGAPGRRLRRRATTSTRGVTTITLAGDHAAGDGHPDPAASATTWPT